MAYYLLTKLNRTIIAAILALLLLTSFVIGQVAAQELTDPRFDLSNNGVVDDVDADMLLSAAGQLQQQGLCIDQKWAAYDYNGDNCINIFDVQILLTHWGERTRPLPPPQIGAAATFTFVVNSKADRSDAVVDNDICDTGQTVTVSGVTVPECTLRAAIEEANSHNSGANIINFNIRNSDGSCPGVVTIALNGGLPFPALKIDNWADQPTTINGYTQCGAWPNSQQVGGSVGIKIQVKGVKQSGIASLDIRSANNVVKGLALYDGHTNLLILTSGAMSNTIQGNILGRDVNYSNTAYGSGLGIKYGASYNLIGGPEPEQRNIVGGSKSEDCMTLTGWGNSPKFNVIINNYIGVRNDGTTSSDCQGDGMDIEAGARYNWIGASPPANWLPPGWQDGDPAPPPDPNRVYDPRERNVFALNKKDGLEISHQSDTQYNYIVNNYIGVNAFGNQDANGEQGIGIEDLPNRNYFYNNVIAGNKWGGIEEYGLADYNHIVNNLIGVKPDGVTPLPNGWSTGDANPVFREAFKAGIFIYEGTQHNLIKNNIIANHPGHGIIVSSASPHTNWHHDYYITELGRDPYATYFNTISQNSIYSNKDNGIKLLASTTHAGNQGLPPPQITSAILPFVQGTTCPNCIVEVFVAATNDSVDTSQGGEGKIFIGSGSADGAGNFSVAVSGGGPGGKVTATATDPLGNTSQFSPNVDAIDNQPPTGSVLVNGGTNLESSDDDVLVQLSAQDNFAVTEWRYKEDNPTLSGVGWNIISSPGPTFVKNDEDLNDLSPGLHTVYAQYKDGDGNVSAVYSANITIVNVSGSNPSVTINNGDLYTNNRNLSLKLIQNYAQQMKIGHDPALSGGVWEPYMVQRAWLLSGSSSQSFNYTVYAQYKHFDTNGAILDSSVVNDTILYDPVSPLLEVSYNTGTKKIDLSGTQDDAGGSGLDKMRIFDQNNPANFDTGWISYQTNYTWPNAWDDTIGVEVRDKAGNISSASISNGEVTIGSGGVYLPIIIR